MLRGKRNIMSFDIVSINVCDICSQTDFSTQRVALPCNPAEKKPSSFPPENWENWVNNVSLHLRPKQGTFGVWSIDEDEHSCSVVSPRCTEKRSLRISPSHLDRRCNYACHDSAEMHRYPSCWVGLQAVGGVPGEGQSAHLVSRFVSSAPTCVLSVLCSPEKILKQACWLLWLPPHNQSSISPEMWGLQYLSSNVFN